MTDWRHNICRECWNHKHPWLVPEHLRFADPDTCCFCGKSNSDGIYIRQDPRELTCQGHHPIQQSRPE